MNGFRDGCRIEPRAEQRDIQSKRAIADAADAERDIDTAPVPIERDLSQRRSEGESDLRALTSKNPTPILLCSQTGNLTALTHSPGAIVVSIGPMKKSSAGIDDGPSGVASMIAPSVTATNGISADGSALAIEPPTVPRLRVGG